MNSESKFGSVGRSSQCVACVSLASICAAWTAPPLASAALTHYADEASWRAGAGATTTIGVPNIPQGTIYMPQLGLSGAGATGVPIPGFLTDSWGLPDGTIVMAGGNPNGFFSRTWAFSQPTATAFAIDWLFAPWSQGSLGATVYRGSEIVGSVFWEPSSDITAPPRFYGFTSSEPFSRVVISGEGPAWGRAVMFSQIPAPSALALIALTPLTMRWTRRR